MSPKPPLLILLTLLLALPILSTDIYLPSLSHIAESFMASPQEVQLTLTLYFLTFGGIQLAYGGLSDRFGRKPMVLGSLLIYITASILCISAQSIEILILGRILQALGTGSAILVFAIIRDLYDDKEIAKRIAYMSGVVAISPIIAPIFGGYIQVYLSWQWNFILLGFVGFCLLIISSKILPETNKYKGTHQTSVKHLFTDYRKLIRNKPYTLNAVNAAFAFGALFSYISGSPYIFLNLMGYSSELFGWTFAIAAIGYVIGSFLNGKLTSRFGVDLVLNLGLTSLVGGALLMVSLSYIFGLTAPTIIIPQVMCEFGISIIIPITVTKAIHPIPHSAGAGSALIGFMRFSLAALSSYLTAEFPGAESLAFIILGFAIGSLWCTRIQKSQLSLFPTSMTT